MTPHRPPPRPSALRAGFSLVELLLVLVLFSLVMGGATLFLSNLFRPVSSEKIPWGGGVVSLAPAYDQLSAAARLQVFLEEELRAGRACIVLGGAYEAGPGAAAPLEPTAAGFSPTGLGLGHPRNRLAPDLVRTALPPESFDGASAAVPAFTLLLLADPSTVSSVVTYRRIPAGTHVVEEVLCYIGGVLQDGSSGTQPLSYRYALAADIAAQISLPPGARHQWLRQNASWGIHEHLGTQLVFPDPTTPPADHGGAKPTFSRFVVFVPTLR